VNPWWWLLIYGGIAIGAGIVLGTIGVRVWRKVKALMRDLQSFTETAGRLEAVLAATSDRTWEDGHHGRHSPGRHDSPR
jgi:hypothetical protein